MTEPMQLPGYKVLEPFHQFIKEWTDGELQRAAGPIDALFRILASEALVEPFLITLTKYYVIKLKDINLLLRDTDCATIMWKTYLNAQLETTLLKVLKKPINKMLKSKIDIESVEDVIPSCQEVLHKLFSSITEFPPILREVFRASFDIMSKEFDTIPESDVATLIVSATLFLRVLCPFLIVYQRSSLNNSGSPSRGQSSARRHRGDQKKLVLLAKLTQLVANNPKDIADNHPPSIVEFVASIQPKFVYFCETLIHSCDNKETTPLELKLDGEQLKFNLYVMWKYAKENKGDIIQSYEDLYTKTQYRLNTEMELYETFIDAEQFENPEKIDGFYEFATPRMEYYAKCRDCQPVCTLARKFQKTMKVIDLRLNTEKFLKSHSTSNIEESVMVLSRNRFSLTLQPPRLPIHPAFDPADFTSKSKWLNEESKEHYFTILIFYRGNWCPWCKSYLKCWSGFVPLISSLSGSIFAVASESPKKQELFEKGGYDMKFVNDTELELANQFNVETRKWKGYSKAMIQPAVVVLSAKGEVAYYWKSYPSVGNFFGSRDRVSPKDVMGFICETMPLPQN